MDKRNAIQIIDIYENKADNCPIDQAELLTRFHAEENGKILSGAAAFAAMWRAIPMLRPLGLFAKIPVVLWLLERAYRVFLRYQPRLRKLVAR